MESPAGLAALAGILAAGVCGRHREKPRFPRLCAARGILRLRACGATLRANGVGAVAPFRADGSSWTRSSWA